MEQPSRPEGGEDPRNRLAGERTLLAWIRTGVTVMGFGFVVARFGYFLSALRSSASATTFRPSALSTGIGVSLVVVGVALTLAAAVEHRRFLRLLDRRQPYVPPRVSLSVVAAATLAVLGLGLAVYLLATGR